MGCLQAIPAFKNWSRLELKAANNASKIVDYPENKVSTSCSVYLQFNSNNLRNL
jgi:hypothetical protein